jgi:serine/threonine-protein kinase RsbT
MTTLKSETRTVESEGDVVLVRQAVRKLTVELKLSLVDQTKMVTAASELARNMLIYGGGGAVTMNVVSELGRNGLEVHFIDQGPGIPDIELALRDGYTSGGGMGLGLGGARRLVNQFEIKSAPGEGTHVVITRWR